MPRRKSVSPDPVYSYLTPLADHSSLAERTYQHLFAAIYALEIKPGEELNEVRLARRLGVSVTPVREALLRLSGDGLVVREPQHPPRVVEFGPKEIEEVYDLRSVLEGFAAAEAAQRVGEEDICRLRELQDQGRKCADLGKLEAYDAYNDAIHQNILVLADNSLLLRTMQPIRVKMRLCMHATSRIPGRQTLGITEHGDIIDRLAAHDSEGATAAMRSHCALAKHSYLETYVDPSGSPLSVRQPMPGTKGAAE